MASGEDGGLMRATTSGTKNLIFQSLPMVVLTMAAFAYVYYMKHCRKPRLDGSDGNTVALPEDVEKEYDDDDYNYNDDDTEMASNPSSRSNQPVSMTTTTTTTTP